MSAIDFLLDDNDDLLEDDSGDIIEGVSDGQNIKDLLNLEPGELKYDPLMGVGITRYINGKADASLNKTISMQLQADRFVLNEFSIDRDGNIDIDAERKG